MRVLVAEDEPTNALLLEGILKQRGYDVTCVRDGNQAFLALQQNQFDALITDWVMPGMDGIALIKTVRQCIPESPAILLLTSTTLPTAKEHALESGADDFLNKPYSPHEVLGALQNCLSRRQQPVAGVGTEIEAATQENELQGNKSHESVEKKAQAPFIGIGINANTGGPNALNRLFEQLPDTEQAAFFVILQAPVWALDMFAMRLQKLTSMQVVLADDGMSVAGGRVYIARKDRHMTIDPKSFRIKLIDTAEQNFARPSADVLFKSLSEAFGHSAIGLIMTGIGRDGVIGAGYIAANQGKILVQDPSTAEAPFLPQTVVGMNIPKQVIPLPDLSKKLTQELHASFDAR